MAIGYSIRQHKHRPFPSTQKVWLDSTALKHLSFVPRVICREDDELALFPELAFPSQSLMSSQMGYGAEILVEKSYTSSVGNSLGLLSLSLFCLQCWRAGWTTLGNWSPRSHWPGFLSSSIALSSC